MFYFLFRIAVCSLRVYSQICKRILKSPPGHIIISPRYVSGLKPRWFRLTRPCSRHSSDTKLTGTAVLTFRDSLQRDLTDCPCQTANEWARLSVSPLRQGGLSPRRWSTVTRLPGEGRQRVPHTTVHTLWS